MHILNKICTECSNVKNINKYICKYTEIEKHGIICLKILIIIDVFFLHF